MEKKGILLVNLGTPDASTFWAVRRYLKEFLSDPRVIEVNRALWWLILNGIILNIRPFKTARLYQSIWTEKGSPLRVGTEKQAKALSKKLGKTYEVAVGMRYGNPSLKKGLLELRAKKVSQVTILPLYPQYSATTTGSVFDAVTQAFKPCRHIPPFHFIEGYHDHPAYIEAMKAQILAVWEKQGRAQKLLFSYHGLPKEYCDAGDPYFLQCQKTSELLAKALHLDEESWEMTFQSRVGRQEWLQPYTDKRLKKLPFEGVKEIQVFCPGFAVDCLETLEEMAIRNRETFLEAGGTRYELIPCLNDESSHIEFLAELVRKARH